MKKKMAYFVLISCFIFTLSGCRNTYQDGYEAGYIAASKDAEESGYSQGYEAGYLDGADAVKNEIEVSSTDASSDANIVNNTEDNSELIIINNIDDFINAIEDNAYIILSPGTYNISEYFYMNKDEEIPAWKWGEYNAPGIYKDFTGTETYGLIINGINNLTIEAEYFDDYTEIVSEPRYSDVISFYNCDNLYLGGLTLGHTPDQGHCTGDVIGLEKCSNTILYNCDLYGCGAYGVSAIDCDYIELTECFVHDCTYGCLDLLRCTDVEISYSEFYNCAEFTMFDAKDTNLSFYACIFKNLDGDFVNTNGYSNVIFNSCLYDLNAADALKNSISSITYDNISVIN